MAKEMVIIIRPSFKRFCGEDTCRAALYNHLLYWIAQKAQGQSEEKIKDGGVYWYGSAEDICAGLDQSWSVWKVRKELDSLTGGERPLIGRRHNPIHKWDREYQYFIGVEQGEALKAACEKYEVDLSELGLTPEVLHLLITVNAFTVDLKSTDGNPKNVLQETGDHPSANRRAVPKVPTKVSFKGNNKDSGLTARESNLIKTSFVGIIRDFGETNEAKKIEQRGEYLYQRSSCEISRYCALVEEAYQSAKQISDWDLIRSNCKRIDYLFTQLEQLLRQEGQA